MPCSMCRRRRWHDRDQILEEERRREPLWRDVSNKATTTMLDGLIELIALIWGADSDMRDSSVVGESEMDRQSRRMVARICGGAIAVLVLLGTLGGLWWFLR